jgi:hypothetical protein
LPVENLETWLGSYGHLVLISNEGALAADKKFLHLHAVWPLPDDPTTIKGPTLELGAENHTLLKTGAYRGWLQFKHLGNIQTIPFSFEIKDPGPEIFSKKCL